MGNAKLLYRNSRLFSHDFLEEHLPKLPEWQGPAGAGGDQMRLGAEVSTIAGLLSGIGTAHSERTLQKDSKTFQRLSRTNKEGC